MQPEAADSPMSALERSMGLTTVGQDTFDGQIESDSESTPNASRAPVQYGDDDSLFGDSPAAGGDLSAFDSPAAGSSLSALDAISGLTGDSGALIEQLEAMAKEFEQLTGEPELQIRSQIALLRSVIDGRTAAVEQSRTRMDAALQMMDAEGTQPADGAATAALHSVSAGSIESIEQSMASVGTTLRADPEAAALVANLLTAAQK